MSYVRRVTIVLGLALGLLLTPTVAPVAAPASDNVAASAVRALAPAPAQAVTCNGWRNAVAGYTTWSRPFYGNCTVWGHRGFKKSYSWAVPPTSNGAVCVQVRGYAYRKGVGRYAKWFNFGCGTSSYCPSVSYCQVPWGNVAGTPAVRAKVMPGRLGAAFSWRA